MKRRLLNPAPSYYPEPDQSNPCLPFHILHIIILFSSHLRLSLPSVIILTGLLTKTLYSHLPSPIRATCSAHFKFLVYVYHPNDIVLAVQIIKLTVI